MVLLNSTAVSSFSWH